MGVKERVLYTETFTVYSFLVKRESGKCEIVECRADSEQFEKLISYVNTNHG